MNKHRIEDILQRMAAELAPGNEGGQIEILKGFRNFQLELLIETSLESPEGRLCVAIIEKSLHLR